MRLLFFMRKESINSWSEVTEDQLYSYVRSMNEKLMADTTISRHISTIRSFWHFMVESGELENDITEGLKAPHIEKSLPKILTEREIAMLLEQPDINTPKGKRDKAMLELLFATGIRASEITRLRIDDIEFRLNCIDFKNFGQDRIVPFGQHARGAIMDYLGVTLCDKAGEQLMPDADTEKDKELIRLRAQVDVLERVVGISKEKQKNVG